MAEDLTFTQQDTVEKLRAAKWVMLTTATGEGKLVSHPMTPQEVTPDADIWFFVGLEGDQADALRASKAVNIAVSEAGSWLSVAGRAEFVEDRAKIDELWDGQVDAYFEGGKADPNLGLLRVTTDSAQFWGVPGGKVAALAQIVKSKVAGDRVAGGSDTVEL